MAKIIDSTESKYSISVDKEGRESITIITVYKTQEDVKAEAEALMSVEKQNRESKNHELAMIKEKIDSASLDSGDIETVLKAYLEDKIG